MGTGNFYNKNASKIFAFETEEEFDYEDAIGNIVCELKNNGFSEAKGREQGGLRSYEGSYIASKSIEKTFCGATAEVEIKAVVRSGYYSGANIDWELVYKFEENCDEIPNDIAEVLVRYYGVKEGLATIQAKNVRKFMEKAAEALVAELERVLAETTEALIVVARFSNGETIYEKAAEVSPVRAAVAEILYGK